MGSRNIALAGFMASGKTTVGKIISELMGIPFIDTDEAVEASAGMSIAQIFSQGGEQLFRRLEEEVITEAVGRERRVIALGGGAVLKEKNLQALKENSYIYLLEVSSEEALRRAAGTSSRPLLKSSKGARQLLLERREAYLEAADRVVDTASRNPLEVAREIEFDYRARSLGEGVTAVPVELGARSYPVFVGRRLLDRADSILAGTAASRALIISDDIVKGLYASRLSASLEKLGLDVRLLDFPHGEASKSLDAARLLIERVADAGANRSDLILALGGGVTGDLAGFVASTFKRGLRFVQVPTTLMAQVDSSIGGKTGVNLEQGKNLVGTFYQPDAVICDVEVLATLPVREARSGMAEVAKYSFLDPGDWPPPGSLIPNGDVELDEMARAVARCVAMKADVVSEDELDVGRRAILNYGHTLGHALEAATDYSGEYTHGEAVAVGMVFAALVSEELGLAKGLAARHMETLATFDLPTAPIEPAPNFGELMPRIAQDKKSKGDAVMVLLEEEGRPVVRVGIEPGLLEAVYDRLRRQG